MGAPVTPVDSNGVALGTAGNPFFTETDAVPRASRGVQDKTITSSTAETSIITAGGAGIFNDLYGLILANKSGTGTTVTIKDDVAGTTRAVIYVPPTDTRGFMLNPEGAVPQAVANKTWTATSSASIDSLYVTALFVKATS
jgi:hypothetical protein